MFGISLSLSRQSTNREKALNGMELHKLLSIRGHQGAVTGLVHPGGEPMQMASEAGCGESKRAGDSGTFQPKSAEPGLWPASNLPSMQAADTSHDDRRNHYGFPLAQGRRKSFPSLACSLLTVAGVLVLIIGTAQEECGKGFSLVYSTMWQTQNGHTCRELATPTIRLSQTNLILIRQTVWAQS